MTTAHERLNALEGGEAARQLMRCCGSSRWVARMLERRPFASAAALHEASDEAWEGLDRADYLEAFAHHPRLGEDVAQLRKRFTAADWSSDEQSRVAVADEGTLAALREANVAYERRFGFVFLLCAVGKGANEVLAALERRSRNEADVELRVAATEQSKITHLRLEKLAP